MKFRTEIKPIESDFKINHQSKVLAIGSCFVENIGGMLAEQGFNIKINPFGILFNPVSILKVLKHEDLEVQHLIQKREHVLSLDFHSKYYQANKNQFEKQFKKDKLNLKNVLNDANCLILTFGTAWVYEFIETKKIVANCQKLPGKLFQKKLLSLQEITKSYEIVFTELLKVNPNLKIMLTVSPVRHIKDGIIENNTSKSLLLMLCHALKTSFSKEVIYYPSYELQVDDLRDYRFYEADLIHPNPQAIQYIYTHFSNSFFSNQTKQLLVLIKKLNALKGHLFLNATDEEKKMHQAKILELETQIKNAT